MYAVKLTRDITESQTVYLEADTPALANDKAIFSNGWGNDGWTRDDTPASAHYVADPKTTIEGTPNCEPKPKRIKLYQLIASALAARKNCLESGNPFNWDTLLDQIEGILPSGSGIDDGTDIDRDSVGIIKLHTSYHHMNNAGYYDGWTDHTIRIKADLQFGFDLSISGKDRNHKDYLADVYHHALDQYVLWTKEGIAYEN